MNERSGDTQRFDRVTTGGPQKNKVSAKKRDRQQFNRTFLYAVFVIGSSLLLALYGMRVANDALALVKPDSALTVTIERGSGLKSISKKLKSAGVIKYRWAFNVFTKVTGNAASFQYGTYELNTNMDYLEIVSSLQKTATFQETVRVTIPEGKELREIIAALDEAGVCEASELWDAVNTHSYDYAFLADVPERENRLEGYLFPDTYEFFTDSPADTVVKKFLDNFDAKWSDEFTARAKELDLSIDEVVTLASIIEREAVGDSDRDVVSSVFHNRINSKSMTLLQSCATVQYVLKERKEVLTYDDIKIDSPYNTYIHPGLPVGPIASPGFASIQAALYPADTDYYYFVVASSGEHIFSKTLAEHEAAIRKANSSRGTGTVSQ
ncbi:MAG TPA: endolytic transglycosylase MltG [Terriglobales bacterium]|nr:endolytic transglycosylase MltG [Terriglobales bacterium]